MSTQILTKEKASSALDAAEDQLNSEFGDRLILDTLGKIEGSVPREKCVF